MAVHRGIGSHDVKSDITAHIDQPAFTAHIEQPTFTAHIDQPTFTAHIDQPEPESDSERSEVLPVMCVLEQQSDSD